jgi:autotransporter-associated beta strand protein
MSVKFESIFAARRPLVCGLAALCLSLGGIFPENANAASATWTGAGGNNFWTNNANWNTGSYPGSQAGNSSTTDIATFTNNSPGQTTINLGAIDIYIQGITIASGSPAFTFNSTAPAYLLFPDTATAGNITINSGVTTTQDFSGLALIRGQSGAGSTAYNIVNNSTTCFMKMPVLTQYSTSGNIRIVFSGASGAPISATGNDRNAQTTELLLNAPVIVYLQDAANDGNFNGGLYIRQGTVSVASVALKSVGHSPLGATNFIYLGNDSGTGNTSTLQFTGAGSGTTDEPFSLTRGNTGVFDITNASGNLILTTTINEINSSITTGSGNLIKTDIGTLTLNAKSSYTGSTTISGGTLSLGTANAITSSTNLIFGGSGTAGILDLGGFSQQLGALSVASTVVAANQIVTNSSAVNSATLVFSNSTANPSTFGGVIVNGSEPVALTILNGHLTLTNACTYSGNTTVTGGTLALGAGGSISNSTAIIVNTNATFDVSGGSFNLNNGQILSGYGVVTGNVTAANGLISPGTNGVAGTLTFTNGLTLNGGVTNHFDLAATPGAAGNDLMIVGGALNLSGTNAIEVNPLGTTLSAGTYTLIKFGSLGSGGATNFQVTGTLGASLQATINVTPNEVDLVVSQVGGTQRTWVGDGSTNAWDYTTVNWLNGATPSLFSDGNFVTFDDTGSSTPPVNLTTTLQPASVIVNATSNYTFSGSGKISGTATLTKTNSGILTILTTNNYSGVTTISAGILQLGNGTNSGTLGTNAIQNSGTLVLNLPGSNNFSNVISGTGKFIQANSGILALTVSNSYSGGTTISNGTLQVNTGAWFGSGNVTNNGALVFNSTGNSTGSAIISGTGAITLANSGTVTLTGNNSYSGGTTINKGTLLVNNSTGSGVGTGAVIVASGATLSGSGVIGGAVTINSGGIFAPGNPVGTLTVSNNFIASNGAILNYTLGTSSDKTIISSNLNLSGTMNITNGVGFTSGTYTLFTYDGSLTLGNLILNLPANASGTIDTNTPGQVNLIVGALQSNIPPFPGALGFGANAIGARFGGSVYHVTNTNDSGSGSFRDAVSQKNRFIVFDVGGTITLASAVTCSSSLTIAGQTAPGGGIAVIGHEVSFSTKTNEIVRFLRIRPGSIASSTEDGINMGDGTNMIFDHISIEFAPYNNIDATGSATDGNLITVQNSILADPIGQQFNAHTESVNNHFSWFYNVLSSGHDRNPLAKVNTIFINNVVNNFQAGYTCADTSGHFSHDIINNYFITGPATSSPGDDFFQFDGNQSVYSSGNLLDSDRNGSLGGSSTTPGGGSIVLTSPWSSLTPGIPTFSTVTAYRNDVSMAGALPQDQVDQNVLDDVTSLGTVGKGGGLWTTQTSTGLGNNGYGVITNGTLPVDTDGDGMPDYWELAMGSNPNVADSLTPGTGGYTKLENYLNWLAAPHSVAPKNSLVDVDLRQYTGGFTNASPVYSVMLPTNGTVAMLGDGHTAEFTATGNFSGLGSFNFYVHASDGSAMTNTVVVLVMATGASQNLIWRGDGAINNWDTASTNWLNGTNLVSFGAGDTVTFDDTGSNTPAINLVGALTPASVTVGANQNYTFAGSGSLGGTMSLAKSGAGILTVTTSNTFTGGTFIQGGTIVMGNASANSYALGTGAVTLGDGTRLTLFDAGQSTDAGTLPNNLAVSGSTTLELPERGGAGGAMLTGSGTFNLIAHYVRGNFNYDVSAFTGTINALTPDNSADFRMGSYSGFANAVVTLSNNINAYFTGTISPSGNTVDFGEIDAPASAVLRGGPTAGRAVTLRIGALGTDSSFAGPIVEQTVGSTTSLVKIGAGTLTLGGANSYSGQTVVSNGTLVVNGSTGTNSLLVVNGTLGGGGEIGGGAAIYFGNAISPGANINPGTVGTLTITNGLALTNATLYFDLANVTNSGGGVNDLISLSGGVLVLSGANTVAPNLINGFLAPGIYTLISGGGSTIGSAANFLWAGTTGSRQSFSFDTTTTPGSVYLNVGGSPPATLVWSGTNANAWDTSTVNWLNSGAADKFYNFDSVIFNDTSTNGNVVISGVVQPTQIFVTNSILNYTLGGGVLGGAALLVKSGSGTLYLSGSNSFTGGTIINSGTVLLTNDTANQFGLGSGNVTLNGGTLTMYDNATTYNSSYWNLIVPTNSTGTFNTDSRCDLYGSLTGGGMLDFNVTFVRTSLYGDWSAFAGNIKVAGGGEFRVLNLSGYPNAALNLSNNVTADFQGAVDPAGTTLQIGALSGVSSSSLLGGATAGNVFTWQVGGANTDATFAGQIGEQNTNAVTAIEKIGGGVWTLTGSNTFIGGMTVSDGTLQVNNTTGSATGTNQVFVATGATLSGNGIICGLTAFDDGAVLAPGNSSGTLTISNELDLSDQTGLQFGLGTNSDKVVVSGNLTLDGQLNITNTGGFGTGTYTLFTYGGALTMNGVTVVSAPAGFIYTISTNTSGQINLIVQLPAPPVIGSIKFSGGNLVLNGSGGPANGMYYILGSTNIAAPLTNWARLVTNQFDGSGNFNFTNAMNTNSAQSFYLLQLP